MADESTAPPTADPEHLKLRMADTTRYEMPPDYSEDKPPSYDSVFGKVRNMKEESTGNVDFAKKMVGFVLCGTVCSVITIVLMLAMPTAMVVIGALYLDDCARERYIPIYLVVGGSFGLLKAVLQIIQQICKGCCGDPDSEEDPAGVKCLRIVDGPISCFMLAWFIAGAVWTYRVHGDYQHEAPGFPDYCNQTLYLFAFWSITTSFILMGLSILCCCIGGCVACCCAAKK